MSLLHACTFLFTPGHAPQRFEKGLRSRADGMVLDLEDAVAMQDKDLARQQVFDWLATPMHTRTRARGRDNSQSRVGLRFGRDAGKMERAL